MMTDVTRCDETKRTEAATNAVQCRGSFPLKHKPTLMIFGPLWLTLPHGARCVTQTLLLHRPLMRLRAPVTLYPSVPASRVQTGPSKR